ncbi:hypothetical protein ACWDRR_07925 [Kitasatospora sp. NPDC003701]
MWKTEPPAGPAPAVPRLPTVRRPLLPAAGVCAPVPFAAPSTAARRRAGTAARPLPAAARSVLPTEQSEDQGTPVRQGLNAVKNKKVFNVPDETGVSGPGVQAAGAMLGDIAEAAGVDAPK